MRIKSVKIDGFRAFEKVENSTFDFTSNGSVVDFASIYAPNGFGKTSFYDAVEWGITHQIQRFDRMDDFNNLRKENNLPLLLNNLSESGKVIVETTTEKFENTINRRKVYKKAKPQNEYFQSQILSQDLIDTFIKEDRAEKRYEKFLEIDDKLQNYDQAYKKTVKLIDYIIEEKNTLRSLIKEQQESLQTEIDFDLEFKKFDQINEAIQFLRINKEYIEIIEKDTFNEALYDIITSQVKSRLVSLEEELIKSKRKIESIRLAINGEKGNDESGIVNYIDNKKKLENFEKRISELKTIISLLDDKSRVESEVNELKDRLSHEQNIQTKYLEIDKIIETYILLEKEVTTNEKKIIDFNNGNIKIESDNNEFNNENIKLKIEIDQLQEKLIQNQFKLSELPSQKNKIELAKNKLEPTKNELNKISNSKAEKGRTVEALRLKINQLIYYENRIEDDLELISELNDFKNQKALIKELLMLLQDIDNKKKDLLTIENKLNSQSNFNNELKEYIARGLDIITQNNSKECPLCNHTYKSFQELSNRIIANKNLDKILQGSLEDKSRIEGNIKNLTEHFTLGIEKLKKQLKEIIDVYKTDCLKLEKEINKISIREEEKFIELNLIQINGNDANLFFNNMQDVDLFESNLKQDIDKIKTQVSDLNAKIGSHTSKINENNIQLKSNNKNVEILKNAISKLKSNKEYWSVKSFFGEQLNSNEINKKYFLEEKEKSNIGYLNLKKTFEEKHNRLIELNSKISIYKLSKEDYINEVKELEKLKLRILKIYDNFEGFIRTEFGIDLKNKPKKQIENEFDKLIENGRNNQKLIENKIERYKIVEILKEDCLKITASKRIKEEITQLANKIEDLKKAERKLNNEKNNLETYLKKTIDEFFYTDLINAIYKKIDPHPDYNSIEFKCEFGDSKPRLQIFTTKINDKGEAIKSVPALYFSTAQINILSLSIFLARALKTKNPKTGETVDCIFIDDPIQSMDSINILSFIDLFRGIITSLGKQLIVSTHEENFHLLLQKKIPKELFKSKFIEFETFGKLKSEIVT